MNVDYRPVLVTLVISVPVFAAGIALRNNQPGTLELAPPVYAVDTPLTAATVPTPTGDVPASNTPVTALAAVPVVVVNETADRGVSIQITPTVPPPPTTTIPRHEHYDIWLRLAECESGGDWSINTGNGYYGGLQFSLQSWRGVGGQGYPHTSTMWEQMYRAEKLLDIQGWGAWPACSRKLGLR